LIRAYDRRWDEMLKGSIEDSVAILRELQSAGVRLLALTNWSAEKFPTALDRFDFLALFEGIVVSGQENTRKPYRQIYELLLARYAVVPDHAVFIDDSLPNVEMAREIGLHAHHFRDASGLRAELVELALLPTWPCQQRRAPLLCRRRHPRPPFKRVKRRPRCSASSARKLD
jgi:2-haloacid dehalogenase